MSKLVFTRLRHAGKTYWSEIFAVFLLLVGIYFFRSESKELTSIAAQIHTAHSGWIWAGILVTCIYILLQAGMYVSSYATIGGRISWSNATELFLKRNFLSVFLPAGGISSLAYAPPGLRKSGFSKLQTHQASGIYAFVGLFTVFLVGVPLVLYSLLQSRSLQHAGEGLAVVFVLLVAVVTTIISVKKKGRIYQFINKHFPQSIPRINEILQTSLSSSQFWITTAYSLGIECCGILHLFIASKAFGIPASLEASAVAYIVTVLLMIVSPFLRGLGAVELSMVYILGAFSISPVHALAITILYRLFEFWLPLLAGLVSFAWKGRHIFARLFPALLVFGLGAVNILSVITPPIAMRLKLLKSFIPMQSINEFNTLVLLIGLVLIIVSAFLIKGHRIAWILAMVLSVLSLLGHIFKALDYEEALLAGSVILILTLSARQYSLKSSLQQIQTGLLSVGFVFLAVLVFGFVGFYFFDRRNFGFSFTAIESVKHSIKSILLIYDGPTPKTKFGREMLRLIHALGFFSWSFLVLVLLKPFLKSKTSTQATREKANQLLEKYGSSAVDYFKINADKIIFFSAQYEAFVAYRVANGFAIVLEEPVCSAQEKVAVLQEFEEQCHKMGLKTAYYRVDESGISYFTALKKHRMLIGQEALLEVDQFTLEGKDKKSLRNALNSLQKKGYSAILYKAPLEDSLIEELRLVSDDWLKYYKKKESIFSQGMFDKKNIKSNDVIAIRNEEGVLKAFLNIIPNFAPEECTYDMIRKTADAPGGCMDALIIELIHHAKEEGFKYINLGLVPMAGIQQPNNTAEALVRYAYEKMKRFRHYMGLRAFKEKYASVWLDKYLIYENDFDLLQLPIALQKVMMPQTRKMLNNA